MESIARQMWDTKALEEEKETGEGGIRCPERKNQVAAVLV